YLQQLIIYNKILAQRNSFLNGEATKTTFDKALLDVLNAQLTPPAEYIFRIRKQFSEQLFSLIKDFYHSISENEESISLQYQSQLEEGTYAKLLTGSLAKDRLLQRTNVGIHKDDLLF